MDTVAMIEQSAQGTSEPAVDVSGSPPGPVGLSPFLLSDAEPGMRQRFEMCCVLRADLAEEAANTWLNEFREPVEPTAWPAMLDGVNCRGALRNAQGRDPHLAVIVNQRRAACSASNSDAKLGWLN